MRQSSPKPVTRFLSHTADGIYDLHRKFLAVFLLKHFVDNQQAYSKSKSGGQWLLLDKCIM